MPAPKILVLPGSTRPGSHNVRLAALAAKELILLDADVTRISLADYELPIYEAELEARGGPPQNAVKLKQMFMAHQGVFIASPEYSASVTPLLKNASAAPGRSGGLRSLMALRQILELGCGALVIPEQVAIPQADRAFNEMDEIVDTHTANLLRAELARLVEMVHLVK